MIRFTPSEVSILKPHLDTGAKHAGFTLVEMMMVIAIIGILTVMVTPALPSILESKSVEKAAAEISGVLETARAEAMSRRTYVHVAFGSATNELSNSEIRIAALASLDGTPDTAKADNLIAVSKLTRVDRAVITDFQGLSNGMKRAAQRAPSGGGTGDLRPDFTNDTDYALNSDFRNSARRQPINFSAIQGFKSNFTKGAGGADITAYVITISPQGEILGATPGADIDDPETNYFRRVVHFGIASTRGTKVDTKSANGAIVTFHGGTGRISTLRP